MSTIIISDISLSDLSPAGLSLFSGSESFLNELSDGDLEGVNGGISWFGASLIVTAVVSLGGAISFSIGYTTRGPKA
jgi:hypothetical protein